VIGSLCRAALAAALAALALPGAAAAHTLTERYQAPLPLLAYIGGAALAVAMSFAFVMLRGARTEPQPPARAAEDVRTVPRWLRQALSAIGLLAWLWIMAQGFLGGSDPTADVGNVLVWVLLWVGVALLSALVGPVWPWLDPFSTIHRLLSAAGARLGLTGSGERPAWPERLGRWPAVIGFAVVVWLELVAFVVGGRTLALVLLAYTLFTLAGMSYFGRQAWRANAEVFSVWFAILNRLAPRGLAGEPETGRVVRRPFASALRRETWTLAEIVLLSLAAGAIIYDGLSQTGIYVALFYQTDWPISGVALHTLVMAAFEGAILLLVLAVGRTLGRQALGAGLLPVAVGYLGAHYLVALLVDSQALVLALNDPLLRGDDLLPLPFSAWQPTLFLPVSIVWSIQLAAVVGGHVLGAWSGHAALQRQDAASPMRQLPLAALMVFLTSLTLWSLGQEVIAPPG
jgi:hypothetical protein